MSFDIDIGARIGAAQVRCRIAAGDGLTVLFGRSGVGKTSVLHMVAGLRRPDIGHVRVGDMTLFDRAAGIDLSAHRRRAGYVFQEPRLFPHRRVRANLRYARRAGATAIGFDDAVDLLGLAALLDRWPATLSGGEARRVAIGRALLSSPAFLLMDEPLSSLDAERRAEICLAVERIRDTLDLPILYVTHDAAEAERLATRIVPMTGEGG